MAMYLDGGFMGCSCINSSIAYNVETGVHDKPMKEMTSIKCDFVHHGNISSAKTTENLDGAL
eukprot:14708170-Ditylum_brightwellii.AAC.1